MKTKDSLQKIFKTNIIKKKKKEHTRTTKQTKNSNYFF